jgi:hypothetical protein
MFRNLLSRLNGGGQGLPGPFRGSIADALLQADILPSLLIAATLEDDRDPRPEHRVASVELLTAPSRSPDRQQIAGPWSERWVLECAEGGHAFPVTFTPDGTGGTDYSLPPIYRGKRSVP